MSAGRSRDRAAAEDAKFESPASTTRLAVDVGTAVIWFYRKSSFNDKCLVPGKCDPEVYLSGHQIKDVRTAEKLASLQKDQYFAITVSPGTYHFTAPNWAAGWFTVAAGARLVVKLGSGFVRKSVQIIPPDEARDDFKELKPVEPKNIFASRVSTISPFN